MKLNLLINNVGAKKPRKRLGRGIGSGTGKTSGRGVKGQKARKGVAVGGFEGGQMPLIKRLPKIGFNCPTTKKYQIINLADLNALVLEGRLNEKETISKELLMGLGIIKNCKSPMKLLAKGGEGIKKLIVKFEAYSKTAKAIIEKVGGQVL